jgi:hypothetical protein
MAAWSSETHNLHGARPESRINTMSHQPTFIEKGFRKLKSSDIKKQHATYSSAPRDKGTSMEIHETIEEGIFPSMK